MANEIAVLTITYAPYPLGVVITVTTDVACTLTLYWTENEPKKQLKTDIFRGLALPRNYRYCFTNYTGITQDEPGDTTTHTFDITPWLYCQTRYFTFRGTIAGIESPSVAPIFEYHHPGTLTVSWFNVFQKAYYQAVRSANPGDPDLLYDEAHDLYLADSYSQTVIRFGQSIRVIGTYAMARLRRPAILFNTSTLPPCTIIDATLRADLRQMTAQPGYTIDNDWSIYFYAGHQLNAGITHGALNTYSKILLLGTYLGFIRVQDLPPPGTQAYTYIAIPPEFVNKTGNTVVTFRNNKDLIGTRPANNRQQQALFIANSFSRLRIEYYAH